MSESGMKSLSFLNGWRVAGWGAALALLALPAVGNNLTDEIDWTTSDFAFAAFILVLAGTGIELIVKYSRTWARTTGLFVTLFGAFATIWTNLAVGILGTESNPINLWFFALLLAGLLASLIVHFRAEKMVWITAGLGAGQFGIGIAAKITAADVPVQWGVLALFAAIWGMAAILFAKARRE